MNKGDETVSAIVTVPSITPEDFGPWEPAMTEEAIRPPNFYCLENGDGDLTFIRRVDVLRVTVNETTMILKYWDHHFDSGVRAAYQEVFPTDKNVDVISDLTEDSGINPLTLDLLVQGGESE